MVAAQGKHANETTDSGAQRIIADADFAH